MMTGFDVSQMDVSIEINAKVLLKQWRSRAITHKNKTAAQLSTQNHFLFGSCLLKKVNCLLVFNIIISNTLHSAHRIAISFFMSSSLN